MRPDRDTWAMGLVVLTAQRATCLRRKVGCVLLSQRGHVLSTGYNGVAAGQPHCNHEVDVGPLEKDLSEKAIIQLVNKHPHACSGARAASGTQLDGCGAIHAEQNALLQCRDIYQIDTCYVSASPCMTCVKLLLNTSCRRIVFLEEYPHPEAGLLWASTGRDWIKFETTGLQDLSRML